MAPLAVMLNLKMLQFVVIVIASYLCYGPFIDGDFVFDDSVAIVRNQDVINASAPYADIFVHDFWGSNITDPTSHKSYRPLTTLTFKIECSVFGVKSLPMKLTNFVLHSVISCFLIPVFGMFGDGATAFTAALLFTIHPIHVEAVSGIVGRADLLATLFYLAAFGLYARTLIPATKGNYCFAVIAVGVLSTFALFSKENGISVLPLCVLLEVIKRTNVVSLLRLRSKKLLFRKSVFLRASFLIMWAVLLMVLRYYVMGFQSPSFQPMDNPGAASKVFGTRALTQNYLYSLNFWLLLCPDWLSFDWALGSVDLVESLTDPRLIGVLLFYAFIVSVILFGNRISIVGLILLVVPFLPASGFVRLGFVIAERILYIPSIGFCLLVAVGFEKMTHRFGRSCCYMAGAVFIVIMITRLRVRAYEWQNEQRLFNSALRVCPKNAKVYYNIARLATDKNEREIAFQYYHQAIELFPKYEAALMNLGNLYREKGELHTAEKYLRNSIEILEEFPAAWMNLGIVQASLKQYDLSLTSYRKALSYRKNYATCLYNLGNLFVEIKEFTDAEDSWRRTIAINPRHQKAWANILALLDNQGRLAELLNTSEMALKYAPDEPSILFTRANALGKLGRFAESESLYRRIIAAKPNYPLYHANLGVLYHRWQKPAQAIACYRQALKIDPDLKSARDNLRKLVKS